MFLTIVRGSVVRSARAQCCGPALPPGAKGARAALTQLPPFDPSDPLLCTMHPCGITEAACAALAPLPRPLGCLTCIHASDSNGMAKTKRIEDERVRAGLERADLVQDRKKSS